MHFCHAPWFTVKLSDVFKHLDESRDNYLNLHEFTTAMELKFGFKGDREIVKDAFRCCNDDGSGQITFEEFELWLSGETRTKQARMVAVAELSLTERVLSFHRKVESGQESEVDWDTERLRKELCAALRGVNARTTDLLESWDKDGDGELSKKEWLRRWKKLAGVSNDLWDDIVRCAVSLQARCLYGCRSGNKCTAFDRPSS
jgi:hypothetical protein